MQFGDRPLRSALFCPATRPDRVQKLPSTGVDLGVVDLEDAVAPGAKVEARGAAAEACAQLLATNRGFRVAVRVNPPRSEWFADDMAGLVPGIAAVMVPKVESVDDLVATNESLSGQGMDDVAIIAGIETGAGVVRSEGIMASGLAAAAYFGAEDYIADIGGQRTAKGREVLYARSHLALVARVHGVAVLDQIVPAYTDDAQFRYDAGEGRALGYTGKLCIHPRQVPLATEIFTPTPDAVGRAERLIETYEAALAEGVGVVTFDGQMVDQPMLTHARSVVAAARHPDEGRV